MEEENNEQTPISIVEEAKAIRDEIQKMKEDLRKENDRQEQIQAREALSGQSHISGEKEKPKEETPEEYKDRVMRGDV